jgi:hypothetical protein
MPRSFSGRTKVFEAFYVGSIPALGAKLAFEAHKDEQAILTRQAVGSIPTGRTKFLELWPNGEALDF